MPEGCLRINPALPQFLIPYYNILIGFILIRSMAGTGRFLLRFPERRDGRLHSDQEQEAGLRSEAGGGVQIRSRRQGSDQRQAVGLRSETSGGA